MRDLIILDLRCIDEEDWHEATGVKLELCRQMGTNHAPGHEQCMQREPNVNIKALYDDEAIVVQAPNTREKGFAMPCKRRHGDRMKMTSAR